jgi:hypothetical protein
MPSFYNGYQLAYAGGLSLVGRLNDAGKGVRRSQVYRYRQHGGAAWKA